jgi:hypothetical protein
MGLKEKAQEMLLQKTEYMMSEGFPSQPIREHAMSHHAAISNVHDNEDVDSLEACLKKSS